MAKMMGKKEKEEDPENVHGVDDEPTIPQKLEDFFDGKYMQVVMTLITIFALFGDDIRLATFEKKDDPWFFATFILCFLAFLVELVVFSVIKEDYKWSFFFWLDFVATFSIIPDIAWITDPILQLMQLDSASNSAAARAGQATQAGTRAGRIVRLVRLIRLIRIAKLYKYCSKASEEDLEEKLREEAKAAMNAKQAALKRVEASRLGKFLSEQTTRKIIVGVLLMLFVIPLLQVEEEDNSRFFGLRQIFWYGRSGCTDTEALSVHCEQQNGAWITLDGWDFMLFRYTKSSVTPGSDVNRFPLLWLQAPDLRSKGHIEDFESITGIAESGKKQLWRQNPRCATLDPVDCPYRDEELDLVSFTPPECLDREDCDSVASYARFQVQLRVRESAMWSMAVTVFIIILLGTLSMLLSQDTQNLVIAPIEKMVNIVKQLADDPLRRPDVSVSEEETNSKKGKKKGGPQLETSMLEATILKIGGLLQVGFGEAGAEVIGNNMSSGDGELNIMIPGRQISAIFGFLDIRRFTDGTEALKEDVMLFVNMVAKIAHHCVHRWSGSANKNVGDAFLFTWKIGNLLEKTGKKEGGTKQLLPAELANKALISFLKIIVEMRRSTEVRGFEHDPRILGRFGEGFQLRIGYGLHVGWAIEGAIGSDFKIDASYLSPHVNFTERLQEATKMYMVPLLMSEPFYVMLSTKAKDRIRKIDVVKPSVSIDKPIGIYTFDVKEDHIEPSVDAEDFIGEFRTPDDMDDIPKDHIYGAGAEFAFLCDADILKLQQDLPEEFLSLHRRALIQYTEGQWSEAKKLFEECLEIMPHDGPTLALLDFMAERDDEPPEDFPGFRETDYI
uniref:Guanylate cyclase domain-containing protein n=1 Tax=Chromera velia CCMP2878 TaxID=1169474 RepID=A0A0G4H167_9ALVE|eukprot:Cvel_811.t1-p1 / transcript=Cvel_811.t1 / gene=Cvel_811 / organism=Chromera_velia_CCMP2878 / gene_product=hypothetical protein / transcript_product=hypothetical protein / location=Cvel_scaffold25:89824-97976(+) / protein_length=841 / sequence_SO=supercontig / SO=protein_coding / is_pseudo=false